MPVARRHLTVADVTDHVHEHVFGTASSAPVPDELARRSLGVELEWLTGHHGTGERLRPPDADDVIAQLGPLPGGGRITLEPGGQLELSSARGDRPGAVLADTGADLYRLDRACAARGIDLVALGTDPVRPPERVLDAPRYAAMEAYFDRRGRDGRTMMCNTASVQLNVGLGPPTETAERWALANALGPTLVATFANSPLADGRPTGWQSSRQRAWGRVDPGRTAPPPLTPDADPAARWLDYALRAPVMLIRRDDGHVPITTPLPFGRWLTTGHELGWPTIDDFAYHLTTLFPPVRPRGWFELRMLDALPTPFWQVAALVAFIVLTRPEVGAEARRAVAGTEHLWTDAAQLGLGHPALARSSQALFALAVEAHGTDPDTADDPTLPAVAAYHERWVSRRRTPGDDRLDDWRRTGRLLPEPGSPVPHGDDLLVELMR